MRTPAQQKLIDFQYFTRMDKQFYGTPTPEPVIPREQIVYGYKDSKEMRAEMNHLERKVNTYQDDIKGLKKLSHTHPKKGTKYNTYSLE